jgi:radical SAM superfamily enzyme YgiQ (UPF0313 family)
MVGLWPNIEYGYLSALLSQAGFDPVILDANQRGLSFEKMIETVDALEPDVIFILGISATLPDDRELAQRLLYRRPIVSIVFWGTHATVRPDDYLDHPNIMVIRREVELAGLALVKTLAANSKPNLENLGVSWVEEGTRQHAPDQPFIDDLDALPMADHARMHTGTYLATDTRKPFALVKTSRGCPNPCVFCTVHAFHGAKWRARSPESIIDEVRWIVANTDVRDIFFQSDLFSKDRDWTLQLVRLLKTADLGITWFCNSRVDTLDAPLLEEMKASGCRLIALGVESGSDTVLEAIGKRASSRQAQKTIQAMKHVGIPSLTYWVFGLPGETHETLRETLRFIESVDPDYAHFYTPTALPGSRLFETLGLANKFDEGTIEWKSLFMGVSRDYISSTMSAEEIEREIRKAYIHFYTRPKRILRELRGCRDWSHAIGKLQSLITMMKNYAFRKKPAE